ncbi:RecQ-mediated genome instability protein 2 [Lemmus lemmus]
MAAAVESAPSGGPGAVRLPRSPPLKVLAGQLRHHTEGAPLELAVVWMQGTVLVVEGGQARLRDPSGLVSMNMWPFPLFPGKYVMVMGVVQACSPEPCLQAVKMTDLSDNPLHESMWELEVEDLHRNIP